MRIYFVMCWRNLWRNPRRSLVVVSAIAVGIFSMLISMSLMNGMNEQMVDNIIRTSLGHVAIQEQRYFEDMDLKHSFDYNQIDVKGLEAVEGLKSWAPRLRFEGMVQSSETSQGALLIGIDPLHEVGVSSIKDYVLADEGSQWLDNSAAKEVLLSKTMAERLDLLVGDKLVVMIQDVSGEIVGTAYTVRGLYESPIESFDRYVVYTGLNALQRTADVKGKISEIVIVADDRNHVDGLAVALSGLIKDQGLSVKTWQQMAPNLVRSVQLFDTMMYIFFAIIFITVIFSIANTLIMAIMERFHEIGVMKSVGTPPFLVGAMVIGEALALGLVGLCIGAGLALALTGVLRLTGLDFGFFSESMRQWGTGTVIYPLLRVKDILASTGIVCATTILAAIYPAFKAALIKPLDALHYQ